MRPVARPRYTHGTRRLHHRATASHGTGRKLGPSVAPFAGSPTLARCARRRAPLGTRLAIGISLATVAALAPAAPTAPGANAAEPNFPAYDSRYHNLAEMVADIKAVEAAHPDIVHVFSIGRSYEGRPIWAAKVSDNVALDEPEPEVLIDAGLHSREHLAVEQALYLFHVLADGYASDPRVKALVDSREIWFIFAVNPDGFVYDLTGHPYRAWRKNRQPNAGTSAIGTDLNRNYDYRWACCGGGDPSALTYRGPAPFSAPETRALRDFVLSRVVGGRQQIRTHVTLHTNGERILYPYGYTLASRPADMSQDDHDAFRALAQAMADRNGYRPMQSSNLYVTDGDEIDWMYGRQRIFSFTFELYPLPQQTVWADHYPPDEHIASQTARNRDALLYLIEAAGCPYEPLGPAKARLNCGPFFDDFEIARGWRVNPDGTDTATRGAWQRGDPEATTSNGSKQLTTTTSGRSAFVTGLRAGADAGANDLDGGATTLRSPLIALPADPAAFGPLSFRYTLAHGSTTDTADGLEAYVEGRPAFARSCSRCAAGRSTWTPRGRPPGCRSRPGPGSPCTSSSSPGTRGGTASSRPRSTMSAWSARRNDRLTGAVTNCEARMPRSSPTPSSTMLYETPEARQPTLTSPDPGGPWASSTVERTTPLVGSTPGVAGNARTSTAEASIPRSSYETAARWQGSAAAGAACASPQKSSAPNRMTDRQGEASRSTRTSGWAKLLSARWRYGARPASSLNTGFDAAERLTSKRTTPSAVVNVPTGLCDPRRRSRR